MTLIQKIKSLTWFNNVEKEKSILLEIDSKIEDLYNLVQEGDTSTFTNGLTKLGTTIKLGGLLTENTTIIGGGKKLNLGTAYSNDLEKLDISTFGANDWCLGLGVYMYSLNDNSSIGLSDTNIKLEGSDGTYTGEGTIYLGGGTGIGSFYPKGIVAIGSNGSEYMDKAISDSQTVSIRFDAEKGVALFRDNRTIKKGLEYEADYSNNYTSRSLVDRGYVDTRVIPVYANDAAADADVALLSGRPYSITGNRSVFRKP